MVYLFLDIETRSKADLPSVGVLKYANDDTTEILCVAYKVINKDQPDYILNDIWVPCISEIPENLKYWLDQAFIVAHNAIFDVTILNVLVPKKYDPTFKSIDLNRVRCTKVYCNFLGVPASLKNSAEFFKLSSKKDPKGEALISKICKMTVNPSKITYENWKDLLEYCIQDVEVLFQLFKSIETVLLFYGNDVSCYAINIMSDYHLYLQISYYIGFGVNAESANKIYNNIQSYKEKINEELSKLTNNVVTSVSQVKRITNYCQEVEGLPIQNLKPESIQKYINQSQILKLRKAGSNSSLSKYGSIVKCSVLNPATKEYRIHDGLAFYGAHTGRFAGRLVQPQNFPRLPPSLQNIDSIRDEIAYLENPINVKDIEYGNRASKALRGMIHASKGYTLFIADYSAIETRLLFFLADETIGLKKLQEGKDIYKDMASSIFNVNYEDVSKEQRQLGKKAILGLGYGMGANKFKISCAQDGIDISIDFATKVVSTYRSKYEKVCKLWNKNEAHVSTYIHTKPNPINIVSIYTNPIDSGRPFICYPYLRRQDGKIRYTNSYNKNIDLWGGIITENFVQCLAAYCLRISLPRLHNLGAKICLTVHDEIIAEIIESESTSKVLQLVNEMETVLPGIKLPVEYELSKIYCK